MPYYCSQTYTRLNTYLNVLYTNIYRFFVFKGAANTQQWCVWVSQQLTAEILIWSSKKTRIKRLLNEVHSWAEWLKSYGQWASSMHPCWLTVQQCGGPRPAHFMQSGQSRGTPGNTKCLMNSLICCDCRAWKACFFAIWGQENPVPRYLQTQTHTHMCTRRDFATPLSGLLSCAVVGIKTESLLITSLKAPPGDKHLSGSWLG